MSIPISVITEGWYWIMSEAFMAPRPLEIKIPPYRPELGLQIFTRETMIPLDDNESQKFFTIISRISMPEKCGNCEGGKKVFIHGCCACDGSGWKGGE